jgi:hypothetical protein
MSDQNERDSLKPSSQVEAGRLPSTWLKDSLELLRPHYEGLIAEMQTAESKAAVEVLFPVIAPKTKS